MGVFLRLSRKRRTRTMAVIYAEIAFVNKKGETKKVRFPMEKESYKAYHPITRPYRRNGRTG